MTVSIRPARLDDAEAVAALSAQFADYLRGLGDDTDFQFDAAAYRRDGFGPAPAFAGLVAERAGEVVGYLLYHFGYDVDRSLRQLWVIDLYVRADQRRGGAGTALLREAARVCAAAGGRELVWAVYKANSLAARFYENLGAHYVEDLRFMYWWPGDEAEA